MNIVEVHSLIQVNKGFPVEFGGQERPGHRFMRDSTDLCWICRRRRCEKTGLPSTQMREDGPAVDADARR